MTATLRLPFAVTTRTGCAGGDVLRQLTGTAVSIEARRLALTCQIA